MMRRDAGYSLVELLATLAILGSMFMLLVSGIGTTHQVWARSNANAGDVAAIVAAQSLLRTRIEKAYPQTRFDASAPYVDFKGAADSVEFLSAATDAEGRQALRRFDIRVNGSGDLVLHSVSNIAGKGTAVSDDQVLLPGVESASVAYYGANVTGGGQDWQSRWQSRPGLPLLVRLHLQFPPGDRRYWPDLIVKPSATVDSMCVLDPRNGRCRGRA